MDDGGGAWGDDERFYSLSLSLTSHDTRAHTFRAGPIKPDRVINLGQSHNVSCGLHYAIFSSLITQKHIEKKF